MDNKEQLVRNLIRKQILMELRKNPDFVPSSNWNIDNKNDRKTLGSSSTPDWEPKEPADIIKDLEGLVKKWKRNTTYKVCATELENILNQLGK